MAQKRFNIIRLDNNEETKRFKINTAENILPLELTTVEENISDTSSNTGNVEEQIVTESELEEDIVETSVSIPVPSIVLPEIVSLSDQLKQNNEICKQAISGIESKKLKKSYIFLNRKRYRRIRNQYYDIQNLAERLLIDSLDSMAYLDELRQISSTVSQHPDAISSLFPDEIVANPQFLLTSPLENYKTNKEALKNDLIAYQKCIGELKKLHTQFSSKIIIGRFIKQLALPLDLELM